MYDVQQLVLTTCSRPLTGPSRVSVRHACASLAITLAETHRGTSNQGVSEGLIFKESIVWVVGWTIRYLRPCQTKNKTFSGRCGKSKVWTSKEVLWTPYVGRRPYYSAKKRRRGIRLEETTLDRSAATLQQDRPPATIQEEDPSHELQTPAVTP